MPTPNSSIPHCPPATKKLPDLPAYLSLRILPVSEVTNSINFDIIQNIVLGGTKMNPLPDNQIPCIHCTAVDPHAYPLNHENGSTFIVCIKCLFSLLPYGNESPSTCGHRIELSEDVWEDYGNTLNPDVTARYIARIPDA